ncbi:pyridoxamine 5'-phosphate oxidase family protein [Mycoplasmatota bacterium WC44]
MFRNMRRKERESSLEDARQFLKDATHGVLSTISVDNGYPYGVTVNHIYLNGHIYFHCAKKGHKIDNIIYNNNVSFTATALAEIKQQSYSTKYKSTTVFGKAYIVEDKEEVKDALYEISRRFTGKFFAKASSEIAASINRTLVVRIEIDDMKGKSNK